MNRVGNYVSRNLRQVRAGGFPVLFRKLWSLATTLLLLPLSVLILFVIRVVKPVVLIRVGRLISTRIGHFAANTELYLCERDSGIDVPAARYFDIFFMPEPICNSQLANMWRRVLMVGPAWMLTGVYRLNRMVPGGSAHEVRGPSQNDRDVHNLFEIQAPHLSFTEEEEGRGRAGLISNGIPSDGKFVCLTVRDSAYLASLFESNDYSYHDYRDSDINNYVLAAEELADRGYYVVRMGAKVNEGMKVSHPRIIDYASNGMRSEFMDIYLGARCEFCISQGTGFDAIPVIFRRPVVYVNMVPISYLNTWSINTIGLFKHHLDVVSNLRLSLSEIFQRGLDKCLSSSCYEDAGIRLEENTPDEIRDAVLEMAETLQGSWQPGQDDQSLQDDFWRLYGADNIRDGANILHGVVRAKFSARFLRDNRSWVS